MLFAVDEAVLQHFGIAGEDVFLIHCPQEGGIEDDGTGIVEHADLVLQTSEVDACLATNGGVDHREQRGGYINIRYTALERRGCKPPRSVTIPPPKFTISEWRVAPPCCSSLHT